MAWRLVPTESYDQALANLGGYSKLDIALETVYEGLRRFPYGFPKEDLGAFSFRYAKTVRIGGIAPLIIIFSIHRERVVMLEDLMVA